MGLLSKLLSNTSADPFALPKSKDLRASIFDGTGEMAVVGESHYQSALEATFRKAGAGKRDKRVDCWAILQPQPGNPHDSNAVAVVCENGTVGYLSREEARKWHPAIAAAWRRTGGPVAVSGRIYRGDAGVYGIWLGWPADFEG